MAYWSIVAVFVYYYEVISRYVFNSPTNWAHESMFLMFGMQYLIAGGFVLAITGVTMVARGQIDWTWLILMGGFGLVVSAIGFARKKRAEFRLAKIDEDA